MIPGKIIQTQHHAVTRESAFRGQNKDEKVIFFLRKHWVYLLSKTSLWLMILLGIPALLLTLWFTAPNFFTVVDPSATDSRTAAFFAALFWGGLYVLWMFAGHRFFLRLIDYFFDVAIVTNFRIIDIRRSVFLHDAYEGMDLHKIEEAKSHINGLLRNILQYGDVTVNIEHSTQAKVFRYVPRPTAFVELINEYKRRYIADRIKEKDREHFTPGR